MPFRSLLALLFFFHDLLSSAFCPVTGLRLMSLFLSLLLFLLNVPTWVPLLIFTNNNIPPYPKRIFSKDPQANHQLLKPSFFSLLRNFSILPHLLLNIDPSGHLHSIIRHVRKRRCRNVHRILVVAIPFK